MFLYGYLRNLLTFISIRVGKIIAINKPAFNPICVISVPVKICRKNEASELITALDTRPTMLGPTAHPISPPKANCPDLPLIKLQQAYDWQAKCIQGLQRINDLFYDKQFAYELLIRSQLCEIWYLMLENNLGTIQSSRTSSNILTSQQRMKQMILYIHHHYTEAITLEDIAKSAHISKSECYRCFQRFLGLKPFEYLMEYRLANAARLLSETTISVIDIAQGCGYNSQSYFTKMFKIYYHITPLQYRLKNSSNK